MPDFYFKYYDAEAARDKAHMNRLQRGAYDDLISAQRKFGHLTAQQIKSVLGNDFEACWTAIEWILNKDETGNYFIKWLDISLEKSRQYSEMQKKKKQKYWDDKKTDEKQLLYNGTTTEQPLYNKSNTVVIPYNSNNNSNGFKEKEESAKEEKTIQGFQISHPVAGSDEIDIDLIAQKIIHSDAEYMNSIQQSGIRPTKIEEWMYAFNRFLRFTGVTHQPERAWRLGFPAWLQHHNTQTTEPENYNPALKNNNKEKNKNNGTKHTGTSYNNEQHNQLNGILANITTVLSAEPR